MLFVFGHSPSHTFGHCPYFKLGIALHLQQQQQQQQTNANLFFDKKKNRKLDNIRPSVHFYVIIFGKKWSPQRNGMTVIPKITKQVIKINWYCLVSNDMKCIQQ